MPWPYTSTVWGKKHKIQINYTDGRRIYSWGFASLGESSIDDLMIEYLGDFCNGQQSTHLSEIDPNSNLDFAIYYICHRQVMKLL
jgi:hypothetical protein